MKFFKIPVTITAFSASGMVFSAEFVDPNIQITQPNAYSPGVHMDQYGRPVKIVPNY